MRNDRDRAALALAWKTASRWDEIQRILPSSIVLVSPQEVIVDWGVRTKASRRDPWRAAKYTVVRGRLTPGIARTIAQWYSGPERPLTTLTTANISGMLKAIDCRLSAHSIKHGAMNLLARHAAEGRLDPTKIALVGKHKQVCDLTSTTIRYLTDRVAAARMLGTHQATELL
jgi:hypothetical protein